MNIHELEKELIELREENHKFKTENISLKQQLSKIINIVKNVI